MTLSRRLALATVAAAATATLAGAPAVAQGEPIKIGIILPYAPPFNVYAESLEVAMKLALEERGGKVAGREIKLIFENDENKPPQVVAKAKKLIAEKVDIIMGGLATNLALPLHAEAVAASQPTIIINAGHADITGKACSPWVVRVSFSNDQIIRDSGPWMFKKGFKSAFVMAPDYAGGREIIEYFKQGFTKAGGKIVGEAFPPLATKDYGPYIAQAKAAKPDVVYVFFPGGNAIQFVVEYDKFGLRGEIPLAGPAWTVSPLFIGRQGKAALGFMGPINYVPSLDNAVNKKFVAAFRAKTNRDPDEVSINGYDAVHMAWLALDAVKGNTQDKKAMMEAYRKVNWAGPRGPMKIDPKTNNIIQNIYMIQVVEDGGKLVHKVLETVPNVQDPPNGCNM